MSYSHTERVRYGDLDAMRHLNNVVFLRYFETARIAYLREIVPAHDPAYPERDDFGLIFAECHINYRSPVLFDEQVTVVCTIRNVKRSSFRVEFEMRVGTRLVAEGYGVLVGFDYATESAAQLPEALRETLEAEAAPAPS
ncbi:MAG TPA: thioesterase family protein [Baekduia sp.]|nr:thioesterase family protein [Baekduia sp.]